MKATNLNDILKTFRTEPLNTSELISSFYYDNTMPIRTGDKCDSPLRDLYDECTMPSVRNAHILMGHRGCGKSTELFNLSQKLELNGQPTSIVDVPIEVDIFNASRWDIMLLITECLCKIAANKEIKVPNKTITSVIDFLTKDVTKEDEMNFSSEIGVEGGAEAGTPPIMKNLLNLFIKFKTEIRANSKSRSTITEKMEKRAKDWIDYIKEISDFVSNGLNNKQPILIFENIDRIPPEKVVEILSYPYLAEMPFPIIYTFPISVYYSADFAVINNLYKHHTLPMIKISNVDKSRNDEGIEIISEIVRLRADLDLFAEGSLDKMIEQTGGVLRDLFNCIISAARRAGRRESAKIEEEDVIRALSNISEDLTRQISMDDNAKLLNIYSDKNFRMQIEDKAFLLEKLHNLVILEYRNGAPWHDLHPLVTEFLIKQGVIKSDDC
ncbi:MAG: hypothetical protein FWC09_10760 [Lachnospiraceae bacterium]|nr:hypothetical protein [Lachnospiraceae bacterium]